MKLENYRAECFNFLPIGIVCSLIKVITDIIFREIWLTEILDYGNDYY